MADLSERPRTDGQHLAACKPAGVDGAVRRRAGARDQGIGGMSTATAPADGVLYESITSPVAYVAAYNALMDEPSNRLRVRAVTDILRRVAPGVRRVIDVACGGGAYTASARAVLGGQARFYPVDRQVACAAGYRLNHQHARPALADVTSLPFASGAFDLALCLDIVEHLDDDVAFLRGIH